METEESVLLALLSYAEVFQHVLRHLNARAYRALTLSCREMREWLRGPGEELLRGLNYAQCGGKSRVRLLKGQTHAALFFSPRLRCVLSLSESGGECVAMEEDGDVACTTACPGDALTTAPNGKLGCFVAGSFVVVFEMASGAIVGKCPAGGPVVYCYFDCSSSVVSWIFFSPPSLRLAWFDLATLTRGDSGELRGSPFFWHLSPWEAGVALTHVDNSVVLLNLLGEERRATVVFAQEHSNARFQVPHLVHGGRSCVVAASPGEGEEGLALLQLSVEERTKEASAALVAQATSQPGDPRLLHRFSSSGMMLIQSTSDDCVIAGTLDEVFVEGLCEIDLRTRARFPIDVSNALAFFLSPCSRFLLLLCFDSAHGQLSWVVFDRRSRTLRVAEAPGAKSKLLLANRRPFQSAYALSHSPWDKRPGFTAFCFVREDGAAVECRVVAGENQQGFELAPPTPLPVAKAGLVWFS